MPETRTRDRAIAEILRLLPEVKDEVPDDRVRSLLTDKFVREVFDVAWDRQFDDDRTTAAGTMRNIIREALEGLTQE